MKKCFIENIWPSFNRIQYELSIYKTYTGTFFYVHEAYGNYGKSDALTPQEEKELHSESEYL